MELQLNNISRRSFEFKNVSELNSHLFGAVNITDDSVFFQKSAFKTIFECEKWLTEYKAKTMNYDPTQKHVKEFKISKANIGEPSNSEWEEIQNNHMKNGDVFEKDDIKIFKYYLANNFPDRDKDRFPIKDLKDFARTLVGKMRLVNHNSTERVGRFFEAKVVKFQRDEFKEMLGETSFRNIDKILDQVEDRDGAFAFIVGKYYLMNITELDKKFIERIYAGLEDYASIGFHAPKWFAVFEDENKKDKIIWYEFTGDENNTVESAEGSGVYLGAQYGAREGNIKSAYKQSGWIELGSVQDAALLKDIKEIDQKIEKGYPLCKNDNGEVAYYSFNKPLPDEFYYDGKINLIYLRNQVANLDTGNKQDNQKNWKLIKEIYKTIGFKSHFNLIEEIQTMKHNVIIELKNLGINMPVEVDSEVEKQSWMSGLSTKVDEVVKERLDAQKPTIEKWDAVKDIFGETVSTEEVKTAKESNDVLRKNLISKILDWGVLGGFYKQEETEDKEKTLKQKSTTDLLEKFDEFDTVVKEKYENQMFFDVESVMKHAKVTDPEEVKEDEGFEGEPVLM